MRGMPAIRQPQLHGVWVGQCQLVKLRHRAVFVILALNRQQRGADAAAFRTDVKAAEGARQPDIVPLSEGAVHVGVMARQAVAQRP